MTRSAPVAGETYAYAVTAKDIAAGRFHEGNPYDCPVALAVKRRHGLTGRRDGAVGGVIYYQPNDWLGTGALLAQWKHKPRVRQFIRDFDDGIPVKPMRFTLTWEKPT